MKLSSSRVCLFIGLRKHQLNSLRSSISTACRYSTEKSDFSTTIDEAEASHFRSISNQWWDDRGPFSALHSMNRLRIPLIVNNRPASVQSSTNTTTAPLSDLRILDVGCGGGILSEPLARLGAKVTGLDMVQENIIAAEEHRVKTREEKLLKNLTYECGSIEGFVDGRAKTYDMVVASEVIEHVSSPDMFIKGCSEILKPGGTLVFTTINRTWISYLLGIVAAEYLCGLVPRGTHDWNKFMSPTELRSLAEKYDCRQVLVTGLSYNTFSWSWSSNTLISYASTFSKA